ncbi:MAG TPA: cytochrome C oxidase subunit IV family protein [Bacteroidia bacterium]|jgi:cytochrome c oxidase subunit IV|nr:cytochrome C oxidase subunit IV family protein [Bacteroidia bacterium]
MEFHDDFPQYEFRDQHDDVEGKKQRRRLWNVFWIMLGITIFELVLGSYAASHSNVSKTMLKIVFISFTILKAYYIVYSFMHLGHEVKAMKWIIIAPYTTFILYLVFMATITEGNYSKDHKVSPADKVYAAPATAEEGSPAESGEHK